MNSVMQRDNERGRLVAEGQRTDIGERCSPVVMHESGGIGAPYPHGDAGLGVRLPQAEAITVARRGSRTVRGEHG